MIAGGIFFFAETVGLWFVYNKLVIPPDRLFAAVCVYHFTVISLCLTLLGIVFNSCIIAHEAMDVFSFLGIFQGVAKLGVVYLLTISLTDKAYYLWFFDVDGYAPCAGILYALLF